MPKILLLDKPGGKTSTWCDRLAKKHFQSSKVGHLGTLDPLATGVLPIFLDEATKFLHLFENSDKTYIAEFDLSKTTDTLDSSGKVLNCFQTAFLSTSEIEDHLKNFKGIIEQTPPQFSALKYQGKPLYSYARKEENNLAREISQLKRRQVEIKHLELINFTNPLLKLKVSCSKGTYIRSLGLDLGLGLSVGAMLVNLRRTAVGQFDLEATCSVDQLDWNHLHEVDEFLHLPKLDFNHQEALKLKRGQKVSTCQIGVGQALLYEQQQLFGLGWLENNEVLPKKIIP